MSSASAKRKSFPLSRFLIGFGVALLICAGLIFLLTFYPVIREEVRYLGVQATGGQSVAIAPVNTDFALVVPKIGANAPVIANVDPLNSFVYQYKLREGVAHARGTALPDQRGNVFLFAHSAGNFYEANRYNAVFYLLTKLEKDDVVELYYKGERIEYRVTSTSIVEATDVTYLSGAGERGGGRGGNTLTLMTCWPAGTTLRRFIVVGEKK